MKAKKTIMFPPISRDVAGRTIVHHLMVAHPVIVSSPVRLRNGVGPGSKGKVIIKLSDPSS